MTDATFPDLAGASVFITGGGSGIGAALTQAFVAQGARVAFVGRSDYTEFADLLALDAAHPPMFIQCDVTDTPALHAAMDAAAAAHGPITRLVANAANDMRRDAAEIDVAFWDDQMAVNLRHYFFAAQRAAPMMQAAGGGSMILFSSISYLMGADRMAPYVAANAGIMGLTRSLAREWGPDRIRVNAIAPGWVMTERQKQDWATDEAVEGHRAAQCLKDLIQPEDMAGTVLFLASDLARMMTGQVVTVDAGRVMVG